MNFKQLLILGVLAIFAQGAWAWGGSGTESDPYQISNANDLNKLATDVNNGEPYSGKYFILTADISNVGAFTPIGRDVNHHFQGNFNGKFHTISGMVIERASYYNGLFGRVKGNATIKNLTLKASTIKGQRYCGGIVGYAEVEDDEEHVEITNCHVEEDVQISPIDRYNLDFGGIAGVINRGVAISGCTCAATIDDPNGSLVGGIVGECYFGGTIKDCLFTGEVKGKTDFGAIAGSYLYYSGEPTLFNNFYTCLTSMGVGKNGSSLGEDIDGARHATGYDNLESVPDGIGNIVRFYGEGQHIGVVARENGLYYDGVFYYPAIETLVLYDDQDNTGQLGLYVSRTADVTLQGRTLYKDASWHTLCLPFSLSVEQIEASDLAGAEIRTLSSASLEGGTLMLNFSDKLTSIEAGKPYIVRWAAKTSKDIENPVFESVTIANISPTDATVGAVIFKGIYSPYDTGDENKNMLYLGADNTLCRPTANMTIGSCRAYFLVSFILGDVNGDGFVNVTDVTLLVNHILGNDNDTDNFIDENADINVDGDINVTDVTELVNIILSGVNTAFNVVTNLEETPITYGGGGSGAAK